VHQEAVRRAKSYRVSESELLSILMEVDDKQVFQKKGYPSLHVYCVKALSLTDSQAYALVGVARKSKTIPELKILIDEGELHLSNARRVASVITPENKEEWLDKATSLSQRDLEREIAKAHPEKATREKIRPLTEDRRELKVGISKELEADLRRVQDLLSQKTRKAVSLEAALAHLTEGFLKRNDPVQKAKRNFCPGKMKPPTKGRRPHPAQLKHEVHLRDEHRCTHHYPNGTRCEQSRWLELHHLKLVSQNGENRAGNLTTLCFHHHRYLHSKDCLRWPTGGSQKPGPAICARASRS